MNFVEKSMASEQSLHVLPAAEPELTSLNPD